MAHAQNSPRGLHAKRRYDVSNADGEVVSISGTAGTALPGSVDGSGDIRFGLNSTGHFAAVNSTGTTWLFMDLTSKQPTT